MSNSKTPRLRTVDKIKPLYPLNQFPTDFGYKLGREIVYLLATKATTSLEGPEWEQIFAHAIGAQWRPSNVGLDDVIWESSAWGAKSVKANRPHTADKVRLISGRNSPAYSFDRTNIDVDPQLIGAEVLHIWNARVEAIRAKFAHVRTVVLIKSSTLTELTVFETETVLYPTDRYVWQWNPRKNLEGYERNTAVHRFTWQPHGAQFTIIEPVPAQSLLLSIRPPAKLDKEAVLQAVQFNPDWVTVHHR